MGPPPLTLAAFGWIAILAVIASTGAFQTYGLVQRSLGTARAGLILHLIPLYTAALAYLFLDERLALHHVAGGSAGLPVHLPRHAALTSRAAAHAARTSSIPLPSENLTARSRQLQNSNRSTAIGHGTALAAERQTLNAKNELGEKEMMTTRHWLLASVCAAFVAFSGAANAAVIYLLDATDSDLGFELRVPTLISTTTTFSISDFAAISLPPALTVISVSIENPLTEPRVNFNIDTGSFGFFWSPANTFSGPGVYCAGSIGCANTAAVMTIREVADASAPASALLLGGGLWSLAALRRRSAIAAR